jgi:tol-pal system protein YbgF
MISSLGARASRPPLELPTAQLRRLELQLRARRPRSNGWWLGTLRSQFRHSRSSCWRSSITSWSMRTMSNRVAAAAIASACVMAITTIARAQVGPADLLVRIDRLENQIRQLTGEIERMQYRNQQLEAALNELRSGELRGGSRPPAAALPTQPGIPGGRRSDAFDPAENPAAPGPPRVLGAIPPQPPTGAVPPNQSIMPGGRRSDAFDPMENPNAPGAPRALGSMPPQPAPMTPPQRGFGGESPPYGAAAGAGASVDPGYGRYPAGPGQRNPSSADPYAVAAGSSPPRDTLDLGMGYLQRRDYALAEETFRGFLTKYPSDRLAVEAQFGLGESLFQLQNYQEAANAFVALSKRYETNPKAPDALLRLGQSLAAMNERELACVAFGDIGRKYPRAPSSVKQAVEREQKRVRC